MEPIIRLARIEDTNAILKIRSNPMYYGRDYISSFLEYMLKHPRMKCAVAEINDEVVCFLCGQLVDGGNTIVFRAGRSKEKCEGHGYALLCTIFILKSFETRPAILAHTVGTMDDRIPEKELTFSKDKEKRNISSFWFNSEDPAIREWLEAKTSGSVRPVNCQRLKEIFSETQIQSALFPAGFLIVNWVPYRCLTSNVDDIIQFRTKAYETTGKDTETCNTVSFGTNYECEVGLACMIDLYGDVPRDIDNHIIKHLKYAISLTTKVVNVHVISGENADSFSREVISRVRGIHQVEDFPTRVFHLDSAISSQVFSRL